jgi:hypothetical protein
MLFSEVYGSYYRAVASVLDRAVSGDLSGKDLPEIVRNTAFGESVLTIPAALTDGSWPLLSDNMTTPLRHSPSMPLTTLEKRWLKSLLADPRIRLFNPPTDGLEDVEPLWDPGVFVFYDRYTNADPYDDPGYIEVFRTILQAMKEKKKIRVRFHSGRGKRHSFICVPYTLEYSAKDDKFRMLTSFEGKMLTVNLARIRSVKLMDPYSETEYKPADYREKTVTMLLTDERNALERALLHFSDLEKETEQLDDKHYRITIWYKHGDETELLIRILSFGPVLQVEGPDTMLRQLQERIEKQFSLKNQ